MNSSLQSHETPLPNCAFSAVFGRLQEPYPNARACFILIIFINILICPFTTVLNALVMIAVKVKPRLRAHNSNILLAALALTDFVVGLIVQPVFIVSLIATLLEDMSSGACFLQVMSRTAMSFLGNASLLHLALLSGERFLAIKQPFTYISLVNTSRLLFASSLAWLLSVIVYIPPTLSFGQNQAIFLGVSNALNFIVLAFIIFCHVTVYRETRRHGQQIVAQQVTLVQKRQFEKDKKALKLTFVILVTLTLCYSPLFIARIVLFRFVGEINSEIVYIVIYSAGSIVLLNSFLNPVIYSVRLRHFRVPLIELMYRTVNVIEAERIERCSFERPNIVVRHEAGQEQGEENHSVEQTCLSNENHTESLTVHEKFVAENRAMSTVSV